MLAGVRLERTGLAPIRAVADRVLDTSDLTVHELRRRIIDHLNRGGHPAQRLVLRVVSFGFKFGLPIDADVVFDARFLPNPYFVEQLRDLPGTDPAVAAYVTGSEEARWFLDTIADMLVRLLPQYIRDGRTYLTIAVGCTGGRHRSVALADALAARLPVQPVEVRHRDVERGGAEGGG